MYRIIMCSDYLNALHVLLLQMPYPELCIWPMIILSTLSLILADEHHSLTYYEADIYPTQL